MIYFLKLQLLCNVSVVDGIAEQIMKNYINKHEPYMKSVASLVPQPFLRNIACRPINGTVKIQSRIDLRQVCAPLT